MTDEIPASAALPVATGQVSGVILTELGRLEPLVTGLTTEQWGQRSAVGAWSNGEVVTHLNLALGLYARVLDAAARGWGSGGAARTLSKLTSRLAPAAGPAFNAVNKAIPRALGGAIAPEVIKGQFAAGARTLRGKLETLPAAADTRPIHFLGSPWPLSFFLANVVNELAIHGWDIDSTLRPDAHLHADALDVLPLFYWGATTRMLRPPAGLAGRVQVRTDNPPFEGWWQVGDAGIPHHLGLTDGPGATITGGSGTLILVLAGRMPVDRALAATSLAVSGDRDLAERFLGSWHIV